MKRLVGIVVLGFGLACGGFSERSAMIESLVELELVPATEARVQLAARYETVILLCDKKKIALERCQEMLRAIDDVIEAKTLDDAGWSALQSRFPELATDDHGHGELKGRNYLRKKVERDKKTRLADFTRWTESDMQTRIEAARWDNDDCDFENLAPDENRIRCRATVDELQDTTVTIRVYDFKSARALEKDLDDTYYPGAQEKRGRHLLNVRLYEEASTQKVVWELEVLQTSYVLGNGEKALRKLLERYVDEVYVCETEDGEHSCEGGNDDYTDVVTVRMGKGDPEDVEGVYWTGISVRRNFADGRYLEVEYVDSAASKKHMKQYLSAM